MSPRQLERRGSLLSAALALVTEIGVERLQMKQVSERSGVALGTAYRYFSSKDHLLAAAMADWHRLLLADLVGEVGAGRSASPTERAVRFVRRGMRAYQRQPELARLRVAVATSTDPFASEALQGLARADRAALGAVLPEVAPASGELVRHMVGHAWQGELTAWVTGRSTLDDARTRLEEMVRLVLAPYEPPPVPAA